MKRILSMILVLALLLGIALPSQALAEDDLIWSFDPATGTLTVTGGSIPNYDSAPWSSRRDQIVHLVLKNCTVGQNAFQNYTALQTLTVEGVLFDCYAFRNCANLKEIHFIGTDFFAWPGIFDDCVSIEAVYLDSIEDWCNNLLCYNFFVPDTFDDLTTNPFYFGATVYVAGEVAKEIYIGGTISRVDWYLFAGSVGIERVILGESVEYVGGSAFNSSTIREAVILNPKCELNRACFRTNTTLIHGLAGSTASTYGATFHPCIYMNNANGTHNFYCSKCKANVLVSQPHSYVNGVCPCGQVGDCAEIGHSYDKGTETKPATCTEEGLKTYTCQICGEIKVELIQALGHSYLSKVTKPTCTEGGFTTYTCQRCDYSYIGKETEPLGHNYGSGVVTRPTCTKEGYTTYTCSTCGDRYVSQTTAPLGHTMVDKVKAPTCSDYGYTSHTCSTCGYSYIDQMTDPTGHINTTTTTINPTCTKEGSLNIYCNDCGITMTSVLPATGHSHRSNTVNPTCLTAGYVEMVCHCGDRYVVQELAPTGHNWGQWSWSATQRSRACILCGELEIEEIQNPFEDVRSDSYYFQPVIWAVENAITTGVSQTQFAPDAACTRAQVVTFLYRAFGEPEISDRENPFTDVSENAYYYDAVLWAVENGITKGMSETSFAPNEVCSRAQVVTFLFRACKGAAAASANPFADVAEKAYYYDAVLWAVEQNITKGTSSDRFSPDLQCTRGQIVTFLYRALQ